MTNLKMAGRSSVKSVKAKAKNNEQKPVQSVEKTLEVPGLPAETEGFVKRLSKLFYETESLFQAPADGPNSNNEIHTQSSSASGSIGSAGSETTISPIPSRIMYSLASALFGLNAIAYKDFHKFETRLQDASGFVIFTKLTATAENSQEYGYEIRTIEGEDEPYGKGLANLVPASDDKGCKLLCRTFFSNENDPMSFFLKSTQGESILGITGLDEEVGMGDVVFITQGDLNNLVGSVNFGYLGSDGDESSVMIIMAGRERTQMVPLTVIDMDGELAFIFREAKDNPYETELLTADGSAIVVAKMGFEPENSSARNKYFGKTFRVEIVDGMTTLDKTLIVGVGVVVFNRWLQKKRAQHCCSIV